MTDEAWHISLDEVLGFLDAIEQGRITLCALGEDPQDVYAGNVAEVLEM